MIWPGNCASGADRSVLWIVRAAMPVKVPESGSNKNKFVGETRLVGSGETGVRVRISALPSEPNETVSTGLARSKCRVKKFPRSTIVIPPTPSNAWVGFEVGVSYSPITRKRLLGDSATALGGRLTVIVRRMERDGMSMTSTRYAEKLAA